MGHQASPTAHGLQALDGDNSVYSEVVLRLGNLGRILPLVATGNIRIERILDLDLGSWSLGLKLAHLYYL